MVPPHPRCPCALVHFCEGHHDYAEPQQLSDSTQSVVVNNVYQALQYLRRSRNRKNPDLEKADRESASECLQRALEKVDESGEFSLLYWRDQLGGDKSKQTFGAIDARITQNVPYPPIIGQYFNGNTPDTQKIRRIGELEEKLYYARLKDSSIPAVAISAYTDRYLLSMRIGRNLAYEVLPQLNITKHDALARDLLDIVDRLDHFVTKHPTLVESTEPERLEKILDCVTYLAQVVGIDPTDACADAHRLMTDVRSEGLSMPNYDPKSPNFVQEDDGTLRLIDLDNAVTLRTTPSVVRAHVAFDPLIQLPLDQRLALTGSLPSAVFYTTYRTARVVQRDLLVPFMTWIDTGYRRARGREETWRALLSTPEARERYPAIARIAKRTSEFPLRIVVRTPTRREADFRRATQASRR